MTRLAILLTAFVQCPQPTRVYDAEVMCVRDAWASTSLPADECGFPDVATQSGLGVGAYHYANSIVILAGQEDAAMRYAVRHEMVHWLAWCTGYQASGDAGHSMPELWGAGGVLERATP